MNGIIMNPEPAFKDFHSQVGKNVFALKTITISRVYITEGKPYKVYEVSNRDVGIWSFLIDTDFGSRIWINSSYFRPYVNIYNCIHECTNCKEKCSLFEEMEK